MTAPTVTEATRGELAAALQAARAKRDRAMPSAQRRYKDAVDKRQALERAHSDAVRALGEQIMEASAAVEGLDRDVSKAEIALRATADPRIEILGQQLFGYWDHLRNHSGEVDRDRLLALIPLIKTAREQLEELALDATSDVDTALHRILDGTGVSSRDLQRTALRRFA